jgi:exonuclease VII large subunit
VENLIGRAIDRSKHVDRTISTLKNISTLSNATINRINKFERTQKSIKVLVAGDFPNYLRETPLQYYTIIPPQRLENTMLVSNQIGASTSIQSNMSHKVESVKPNDNEEKHENINNLLHKLEEQSKKIESLEKSANANRSYSLSQSDINAITDDLLYKLENQSTIENFRKGIF